jgi:hypothetical protein
MVEHCFLPVAAFSSGEPSASERSECLLLPEDPLGRESGFDRLTLNLPEGAGLADFAHSNPIYAVPYSCKEDAVCTAPRFPSSYSKFRD